MATHDELNAAVLLIPPIPEAELGTSGGPELWDHNMPLNLVPWSDTPKYHGYWVWIIAGEVAASAFLAAPDSIEETVRRAVQARSDLVAFVKRTLRLAIVDQDARYGEAICEDHSPLPRPRES